MIYVMYDDVFHMIYVMYGVFHMIYVMYDDMLCTAYSS